MITMILEKGRELKSNDGEAVKSAQADLSGVWVGGGGWALMGALGLARGCGDGPFRLLPFLLQVKKGSAFRRKRTVNRGTAGLGKAEGLVSESQSNTSAGGTPGSEGGVLSTLASRVGFAARSHRRGPEPKAVFHGCNRSENICHAVAVMSSGRCAWSFNAGSSRSAKAGLLVEMDERR